jgi:hypothetical protein
MRRALRVHPDFPRGPVTRIEVEIERSQPAVLTLTYELTGQTAALKLPASARPERTDGLWRTTCFEAFVMRGPGPGYLEFNLSPSGRWAAYRFGGHRQGMAPLELPAPPPIQLTRSEDFLTLNASLDLSSLADPGGADPWRLGISAVIQTAEGAISYWALAHPAGKPDFHHADGFACLVRPPEDA